MPDPSFVLSCCSTVDLTKEHLCKRNIAYVCFHYELDGTFHTDDFGQTIPIQEFYEAMKKGASTKTSQVNVQEYIDHFTPFLKAGQDILHITLSSGISGTYNSATIAAQRLREEFPQRTVRIVDSLSASSGYGLLVTTLADLRDAGMGLDEAVKWTWKNRGKLQQWFISTDLTWFIRGGRISKTAGLIGGALNICPLMRVAPDGKLEVISKIRTKKKAMKELVTKMRTLTQEGTGYIRRCYISHSACHEDARLVADMIEEAFPGLKGQVQIFDIGTTIGSHTGLGTIALFFWGVERE